MTDLHVHESSRGPLALRVERERAAEFEALPPVEQAARIQDNGEALGRPDAVFEGFDTPPEPPPGPVWDEETFAAGEDEAEPMPTNPKDLYDNFNPLDYYKSIPHMLQALRKQRGEKDLQWGNDTAWYAQAVEDLTEYAKAQTAQAAIEKTAKARKV